jgi:hypothetical protein
MITGIFLVLFSWIVLFFIFLVLGYPAAYFLRKQQRGFHTLRSGTWLGLLIGIILILIIGIFVPLRSSTAAIVFALFTALSAIITLVIVVKSQRPRTVTIHRQLAQWILLGSLAVAVIYLAAAALGPVTNYDSGLYHLGAIKYAGDFATIPGLSNLYFPFGYNTSLYPLGAFLGNGPWAGGGYRLANGFIVFLLVMDLAFRLVGTRKRFRGYSIGTCFLLLAVPTALIPLVSLSDYWVTSPSSDAAVFVITLISTAYLLDALITQRNFIINASVSFTAAVILFSLRPTMAVFLVVLTGVVIFRSIRLKVANRDFVFLVVPAALGLVLLAVQSVRDYILTGWLQYPLSVFSFDVPWKSSDPVWNREATLGNARNPADIWGSVDGFDWLGPYFSRLPSQWESYLIIVLAVGCLLAFGLFLKLRLHVKWRTLALSEIPLFASITAWFLFTPPTFRFGWGPVFSFFLIFMAFILRPVLAGKTDSGSVNTIRRSFLPAISVLLVLIVGFNTSMRLQDSAMTEGNTWTLGPVEIPYSLAPVVQVPIINQKLSSGLIVVSPTESDQCWDNYPLCSPIVPPSISLRGASIQDGFLP